MPGARCNSWARDCTVAAKNNGPSGSPCWTPPADRMVLDSKSSQGREGGNHSGQHGAAREAVEGIAEIKFQQYFAVASGLLARQPRPHNVNGNFSSSRDPDTELGWPQKRLCLLANSSHEALARQTTHDLANGDGADTTLRFRHGNKGGTGEDRSGSSTRLTACKQIDNGSKLLHESKGLARLAGLTKVLDSKARRARGSVSRKRAQGLGDFIRRHLLRKRQGSGVDSDGGLARMKLPKGISRFRGVRAEAFRHQRVASLTVEPLPS